MLNGTCTPRKYTGAGSVTDNVGCKRYNSVSRCPLANEGTGSFPIAVADPLGQAPVGDRWPSHGLCSIPLATTFD